MRCLSLQQTTSSRLQHGNEVKCSKITIVFALFFLRQSTLIRKLREFIDSLLYDIISSKRSNLYCCLGRQAVRKRFDEAVKYGATHVSQCNTEVTVWPLRIPCCVSFRSTRFHSWRDSILPTFDGRGRWLAVANFTILQGGVECQAVKLLYVSLMRNSIPLEYLCMHDIMHDTE